jgi:hypothetical protein
MNLAKLLADPLWRLTSGHLYRILPADGQGIIPFQPRPEQVAIFKAIYEEGATRILVPKARRLGMSTAIGVYMADRALWQPNFRGSLIDQNAKDASKKLNEIIKVAIENLPEDILEHLDRERWNDSHVTLDLSESGPSDIFAGMNARGGSNDLLWISEWGVIQFEDPKRSSRIRSGALPSARHGVTIVETTWAGGQGGDLWELMEPSLTNQANDWRILFFPWWVDPRNVDYEAAIDPTSEAYFQRISARLEREGIKLTEPQMRWYARERRAQGIWMMRENPTFLDECWSSPVKGAIYAQSMGEALAQNRIANFPLAPGALVHTSWDLGSPENTTVWYWQVTGQSIRIIDCDTGLDLKRDDRIAHMMGKGYPLGYHYFPHDAHSQNAEGTTMAQQFTLGGLPNIRVLPRTHDIWVGINALLELFPVLEFNEQKCSKGIRALNAYRKRDVSMGSAVRDEPVHDWASHPADALRMMAEAHLNGHFKFAFAGHSAANNPIKGPSERRQRRGMKAVTVGN